MSVTFYTLMLAILVSGCVQPTVNSNHVKISTPPNTPIDHPKKSQAKPKFNKIDSIDKANNESVIAAGENITKPMC